MVHLFSRSCAVLRVIAVFVLCLFSFSVNAAELIKVPGTTVSLKALEGFTLSEQFTGLENQEAGASFVINELPLEGKSQLEPVFSSLEVAQRVFTGQGIKLEREEALTTAEGEQKVFIGTQNVDGDTLEKWIGLYVGEKLVLLTYQGPAGSVAEEKLQTVFAAVELSAAATIDDKLALLPYQFGEDLGDVRLVDVLTQSATILTIGPKDVDPTGEQPLMIIAPSLAQIGLPASLEDHSLDILKKTSQIKDVAVLESTAFDFADAKGYKLLVDAKAVQDDQPLKVIQWMRYDGDKYLRVIGMMREEQSIETLPKFQKVVDDLTVSATQ